MDEQHAYKLAEICNISLREVRSDFSFTDYLDKFQKYNLPSIYHKVLFNLGCERNLFYKEYNRLIPQFNKQDIEYCLAVDRLNLLKVLLANKEKGLDITFRPTDLKERFDMSSGSLLNQIIIDTLITDTYNELISTNMFYLNNDEIFELLETDYFVDWIDKWCAENKITSKKRTYLPLYYDFNKTFEINKLNSLTYINFLLYVVAKNDEKLMGYENKRINPLKGEDNSDNVRKARCHIVIQSLVLFLHIDVFFKTTKYEKIEDMPLSNKECEFIYDFLNYFKIYYFQEKDTNNTSSKSNLIRSQIRAFPKSKANKIFVDEVNVIIENINLSKL